jgi:hypothetical protein
VREVAVKGVVDNFIGEGEGFEGFVTDVSNDGFPPAAVMSFK